MQHTTVAVDVAKSVFQVAISRKPGRVDEEHRLSRARFSRRMRPGDMCAAPRPTGLMPVRCWRQRGTKRSMRCR